MLKPLKKLLHWLLSPYRRPYPKVGYEMDYSRSEYSFREHPKLHGVTLMALGAVMVAATGSIVGWWQISETLLLVTAIVAVVVIELSYLAACGLPPRRPEWRNMSLVEANLRDFPRAIALGASYFTWGSLGILAGLWDIYWWPSISWTGVWLALSLLVWHLANGTRQDPASRGESILTRLGRRKRLSSHYLVMSVVVFATSFLPFFDLMPSYRLYADASVLGLVTGSAMIVGGALDHYLLTLDKPRSNESDRSVG